MALGKEHNRKNSQVLLYLTPLILLAALTTRNLFFMAAILGFVFATQVIHPDLDQAEIIHEFSLWNLYWWPYGKAFTHRHWLSHWPILSTAVRKIYFTPVLIVIDFIYESRFIQEIKGDNIIEFARNFYLNSRFLAVYYEKFWFIGEVLADTVHFVLDITGTEAKTINRKLERKNR